MTISQESAIVAATNHKNKNGYRSYELSDITFRDAVGFREELPFLPPSPAMWLVRFKDPHQRKDVIIEDGDSVICIYVDANSGATKLFKGL